MYNNQGVRLASNGGTATIGDITYTGRGVTAYNDIQISMNKNGTIYTPVVSGQPKKSTYTSGTMLTISDGGNSGNPVLYLFSPN